MRWGMRVALAALALMGGRSLVAAAADGVTQAQVVADCHGIALEVQCQDVPGFTKRWLVDISETEFVDRFDRKVAVDRKGPRVRIKGGEHIIMYGSNERYPRKIKLLDRP
jgi:hypothetical protein